MARTTFIDGTPIPPGYEDAVARLVRGAAEADPGETGEVWEARVRAYEAQGMTRSDAQAVVDAEDLRSTR